MPQRRDATGPELRVVREEPVCSFGDAYVAYWADNATQDAIERASEHTTRHEDDDYGDVDGERYQQRVRDLRDQLRAVRGQQ